MSRSEMMRAILNLWPGSEVMVNGERYVEPEVTAASKAGGTYLEDLTITDLMKMTESQWEGFIRAVGRTYYNERTLRDEQAAIETIASMPK